VVCSTQAPVTAIREATSPLAARVFAVKYRYANVQVSRHRSTGPFISPSPRPGTSRAVVPGALGWRDFRIVAERGVSVELSLGREVGPKQKWRPVTSRLYWPEPAANIRRSKYKSKARGTTKTTPHQRPVAQSTTTTTVIQTASSSRITTDAFRCRRSQFMVAGQYAQPGAFAASTAASSPLRQSRPDGRSLRKAVTLTSHSRTTSGRHHRPGRAPSKNPPGVNERRSHAPDFDASYRLPARAF
jgi:hypothetical protein